MTDTTARRDRAVTATAEAPGAAPAPAKRVRAPRSRKAEGAPPPEAAVPAPDAAPAAPRGAAPAPVKRVRAPRSRKAEGAPPPDAAPGAGAPDSAPRAVPGDFVTDTEHPTLSIPFGVQMGEQQLDGVALSVAAAYVNGDAERLRGRREVVRLQFAFDGFAVTLFPEVVVAGSRRPGEVTLQFADPLGPHLPQLRHIINSVIAGDLVSMGGLLSYAGPVKPKAAKPADPGTWRHRARSAAMAALSLGLIAAAGGVLVHRATTAYEPRPVFVERAGEAMRATTAGQISYLNPAAAKGEVVFSINANTGDVLNFQLPCDCQVAVTDGVFEGATVLPEDVILSVFESNLGVRVQTQISIEGLARVMDGDRATLVVNDGRVIPVRVEVTSATSAALDRAELFAPVDLVPAEGALGAGDIGLAARLRLSSPWLPGFNL